MVTKFATAADDKVRENSYKTVIVTVGWSSTMTRGSPATSVRSRDLEAKTRVTENVPVVQRRMLRPTGRWVRGHLRINSVAGYTKAPTPYNFIQHKNTQPQVKTVLHKGHGVRKGAVKESQPETHFNDEKGEFCTCFRVLTWISQAMLWGREWNQECTRLSVWLMVLWRQ